MKKLLISGFALAAFAFLLPSSSFAQLSHCSVAGVPTCDGFCNAPGETCMDAGGGQCECVVGGGPPCESAAAPLCWGECPPGLACFDMGGTCACDVVPTLSEWGILFMTVVMLGGVLYLRRRRLMV